MIKTVSTKIAFNCLRSGLLDHLDDEQLFRACGISRYELLDPNGRIDARRHFRFLTLLMQQQRDLHLPEPPTLQHLFDDFLPLASVCTNAPTLREALQRFARYRPLIGECDELLLQPEARGLRLRYRSDSADQAVAFTSSCFNFMNFNALVQLYAGDMQAGLALNLPQRLAPALRRRLAELFDCPVEQGGENGYLIANAALDRPFAGFSSAVQRYQLAQAERALFSLHPITNLVTEVRQLLRQRVWQGDAPLLEAESVQAWLCERLRMSRWSLVRRLQQEGMTFSALYAQVRGEEACRLLRDTQASMLDISHQLGFANQSSFTRFFKEQQHCTPMQYRQQRLAFN
ncbi:helix-turn-helix domain-containing protein [Pseudaeromonas sharmana]|uniref:Helix-turn-helix domain-containing protein n=1 Tax=Pseudaeromonas sharmana TaxID=328412 RepID=A0ABV8CR42_9GAMM